MRTFKIRIRAHVYELTIRRLIKLCGWDLVIVKVNKNVAQKMPAVFEDARKEAS